MKKILLLIPIFLFAGCAQPQMTHSSKYQQKVLTGNNVDFLTLFRVDYHIGNDTRIEK